MGVLEDLDKQLAGDPAAAIHERGLYGASGAVGKRRWHG
jgi:hypothetical protein